MSLRRGASFVHGVGGSRGRSIHGGATGALSVEEAQDPDSSPSVRARPLRWKMTVHQ